MIFDPRRIQELQLLGGEEFANEMWRMFLEMCEVEIPRLEAALKLEKTEAVASIAHLLRSASGNVGASALNEILTEIETAALLNVRGSSDLSARLLSAYTATRTCEPASKAA